MGYQIPDAALASHIAILGKTGSGKSNAAKVMVEGLLDAGERVCIIDPTAAWYGLRLKADGSPSKYPVVIFGGLHGDVEIGRSHGAVVAEVVATSATPAVIDTRLMGVNERTEFFTAFAETLLRKNRGPLHLIIDEAHIFAPQSGGAGGKNVARNEMLHAANNLVSLGRSAGLRITLISQRPAKLHKDSLTQVETLVAMRLFHNLDVDAVKAWIGEWTDPQQGKEIVASLPSLAVGDAWVWMPEIAFLKRVHFPLAKTYDSGKAPTGKGDAPELKPLDLKEVTDLLGKAGESIKANDPRALKAEVQRLTRELARAEKAKAAPPKPEIVQTDEKALEAARADGRIQGYREAVEAFRVAFDEIAGTAGKAIPARSRSAERSDARPPTIQRSSAPTGGPGQRILSALAWWSALGHERPLNEQVAFIAGYSHTSTGYTNPRGALKTAGLVEYPEPGRVSLTDAGREQAEAPDAPPTGEELRRRVLGKLPGPQQRILSALIDAHPDQLTNEDCASRAGYSHTSTGYTNPRGNLKTLNCVTYPVNGSVRAADWLFP